ncbi:MAG TPA: peptidylprolyl isomerase, partial [Fibrobacteraceae bacterium]|nr:peptidylprolyl isomerase [Fibrobacteraceae bacterium]
RIQSFRQIALDSNNFSTLATRWSQDEETSWKGGCLGWMERSELDSAYQQVIANLDKGEISDPVKIDDSWHIFRLDDAMNARALTLEDDYGLIESYVANHIANQKLDTLVQRWRKEVYIEVRLDRK